MISSVEKKYNWEGNFQNYKVTYNDNKISFVPHNTENKDYQEILEWVANGGTIIDNGS